MKSAKAESRSDFVGLPPSRKLRRDESAGQGVAPGIEQGELGAEEETNYATTE